MESHEGELLQGGIEALDFFAGIYAKEYLKSEQRHEKIQCINVERCAKLSYEFAKIMEKERIRVLNKMVEEEK